MVAIKALISLLPFYLALTTTAMPQYPALNATTPDIADKAVAWDVSASDSSVSVNFYEDKNPDHSTPIDPNTCKGQAMIAEMKWKSECKSFGALWRHNCWSHCPSESRCCPLPKEKSCKRYWPKKGE
jgi:hypothetical protein